MATNTRHSSLPVGPTLLHRLGELRPRQHHNIRWASYIIKSNSLGSLHSCFLLKMVGLRSLCALLLASSAFAHVRMTAINVNGAGWQTTSVRLPPNNSPVTDVTSNVSYHSRLVLRIVLNPMSYRISWVLPLFFCRTALNAATAADMQCERCYPCFQYHHGPSWYHCPSTVGSRSSSGTQLGLHGKGL